MGSSFTIQILNTILNSAEAVLLLIIVYEKWLNNRITVEKQDSINARLDKLLTITTDLKSKSFDQETDDPNTGKTTTKTISGS